MDANGKSHKNANSGEDMMAILADDVLRYDMLAEREEMAVLDLDNVTVMEFPIDHDKENTATGNVEELTEYAELAELSSATATVNPRFVQVSAEECDDFLLNSVNKNTKYKTVSDIKMFKDWARETGEYRELEDIPAMDLDGLLARMYLGLRKKNGGEYEPDTLTSIQNSIDRHLRDLKINHDIKKAAVFSHSRRVLESKRKALKQLGKGNKSLKADPLTSEEVSMLHDKKLLGPGNPESLLNSIWLNNGVYFGLRGRQDHTNLLWGDIQLKTTSDGKEYLEFNERSTKTRSGAKQGDYRRVAPKMFEKKDDPLCPVTLYKQYRSHRPDDINHPDARFYLKPLCNPQSNVWYSHQPVGKDKLGKMMNSMADKGDLRGRKVNHSTRKTFATTLIQAGLPPTEVAHLGGWKNIQTINEYSVPSAEQQRDASDIISSIMVPTVSNTGNSDNSLGEIECMSTSTTSNMYNRMQKYHCQSMTCNELQTAEKPMAFFSGANISGGNITINLIPPRKRKLEVTSCSASSTESSQ